ncbi:hypothetical protein GSF22_32940, partial [Micromonospora echinofusca]|nr:hypothetical protein [Micromonospora echinofusca]
MPILIDGRLVMPPGVAVSADGQLYIGLDPTAARALPPDHQFVTNPALILGPQPPTTDAAQPVDPAGLLAAMLRHVALHATHQAGGPVTALTVTIPANWGPRRRGQLTTAVTHTGLPSPALVTAPAALAAHARMLGLTFPTGSCLLTCQTNPSPAVLTVIQATTDGYRELATRQIDGRYDLDHLVVRHVIHTATGDDDPLRTTIDQPGNIPPDGLDALLESVRTARHLLTTQERAPILLPEPRQPAVITRDDVTTAAQPLLAGISDSVDALLDAADVDRQHLHGVVLRHPNDIPGLAQHLAAATGTTPVLTDHPHGLADGALTLTSTPQPGATAASTQLPRVRLRVSDLTGALVIGACSLALLLQAILTADITTIYLDVIGVRTSLPQLGTAGALAMITAYAVAHLAPTT